MSKRIWEVGATIVLLGVIAAGVYFVARRWTLNEALVQAVGNSRTTEVQSLLRQGADPNYREREYQQPLITYAARSSGATLKLLLQAGGDPNLTTKEGEVPLVYASGAGYRDIVQILLRYGADIGAAEPDGRSALMAAAFSGESPALVKELLNAGARVDARNRHGETALDLAQKNLARSGQHLYGSSRAEAAARQRKRRLEIVRLLQAAGDRP